MVEVSGWIEESELKTEAGQWSSWNGYSPEREFCDFAASLITLIKPKLVIETGVGQGYITRRTAPAMPEESRYVCFETHPEYFRQVFEAGYEAWNGTLDDPFGLNLLKDADLTILDSAGGPIRLGEIETWHKNAKEGSYVLIHDVSHWHAPTTGHYQHWKLIVDRCITGVVLNNPRGSFLGQK